MLARVFAITLNTYREAVRARILLGLFGLALATAGYTMVVGEYASKDAARIVSDVGAFSISLYAVIVAVLLGATSLYRELELKTVFPILARPIRRSEYLLGKYLGAILTLLVFIAANAGALLLCLHFMTADDFAVAPSVFVLSVLPFAVAALRWPRTRTFLPIAWSLLLLFSGYLLAASAPGDRQVIVSSCCLALFEVCVVTALATLFSSFSTPFLTAVLTLGVFVVGRSADALAKLPPKMFGQVFHDFGVFLSKVFPNLMVYVPPRPLLLGQTPDVALPSYLALAGAQALAWVVALLVVAALLFSRRDFV